MDGDGITMTTVGSPPPSLPDAVGSQEEDPRTEEAEAEAHSGVTEEEEVVAEAEAQAHSDVVRPPVIPTDELREKIIRQVEYYFSDENLPTDKFLMKYVKKNKEGFVPVAVVASFRKMRKLVQDNSLVVTALRESSQLVLSSDGKKVKRIHPMPGMDVKDTKSHIVVVENLPEDCSTESLQRIFGVVGRIKSICKRDPRAMNNSTKGSYAEMMVSGKVHALVEYETVTAAGNAVATLNDEKDWRSGMRVELLVKRMGKYGLAKKGWKGSASDVPPVSSHTVGDDESNITSLDDHDETPDAVEPDHLPGEKIGRKSRGRGRSRGQQQYIIKGHGSLCEGRGPGLPGSGSEGVNKPPPGPKMPDGTRGFILGRGRPPPCDSH